MAAKKMTLKRRIRRENQRNRTLMDDDKDNSRVFSDIIIYEILTRVPIESLMRFRCVCKQWNNIIWDPLFLELHSRRIYNESGLIFVPRRKISSLNFFDITNKVSKRYWSPREYEFLGESSIEVLCSSNGLLVISWLDRYTKHRDYFVYNPITGRCSENLPEVVIKQRSCKREQLHFCLAYDSTIAKYKVVCFVHKYYTNGDNKYFCKILTLGVDDSWRDIALPNKPHNYTLRRAVRHSGLETVYGNGALFVVMELEESKRRRILGLDVNKETWYTKRLPKNVEYDDRISLLEMEGLLCLVHYISSTVLKFWVLKDQWRHGFCSTADVGDFSYYFEPCAILKHPNKSKSTTKLILWSSPGYDETEKVYSHYYYSFDMELKEKELISKHTDALGAIHWHVNSLSDFD